MLPILKQVYFETDNFPSFNSAHYSVQYRTSHSLTFAAPELFFVTFLNSSFFKLHCVLKIAPTGVTNVMKINSYSIASTAFYSKLNFGAGGGFRNLRWPFDISILPPPSRLSAYSFGY